MEISTPVRSILAGKGAILWSVRPDDTVFNAIEQMAHHDIGALPVVDDGLLVGMISERDYTRKIVLVGRSSRETRVSDIMTHDLVTVTPDDSVQECMRLMTNHRVRHLPVLEVGRLTGIISIGDVVNWIIGAQSAALDDLENYVTGAYPA